MSTNKEVSYAAQVLLARREHSQLQLRTKLQLRGFQIDIIEEVIFALAQANLQCDMRYAEACFKIKVEQGYGPNFIRQYLGKQGISSSLIDDVFAKSDIDWIECIEQVWCKKFAVEPKDLKEKYRQQKFLYYRGFDSEHINQLYILLKT